MTREDFIETERLLFIARRAARKLETMYARGECARRDEVDELLRAYERLSAMGVKLRDASATSPDGTEG